MPTLGQELRRRREEHGVTLTDISEATRIGTRFLKAIETDNFSILPGGIFTRSFIRAYARHVGMDEDEAIGLYLHQSTGVSTEHSESPAGSAVVSTGPVDKPGKRAARTEHETKVTAYTSTRASRPEPAVYRITAPRGSWSTFVIGAGVVVFVALIVFALVKQLNQGSTETETSNTSVAQKTAPAPKPATPPSPS